MTHTIVIMADEDDLLALQDDLRAQPDLRGLRVDRQARPPAPGEMGPTTEALQWISDNKELLTAAFEAVTAFLAARRSKVKVRVDEREVEIESSAIDDPERLAEDLVDLLRRD